MFNPLEHGAKPISANNTFNPLEHGATHINKGMSKDSVKEEPSFGDYGQAIYQGLAKGTGKLVDTGVAAANVTAGGIAKAGANIANQIGSESLRVPLEEASDKLFNSAKDYWQNPKVEQAASDLFDTGFNNDRGIQVAQAAGQTATELLPFNAVGTGVQLLTKAGGIAKLPWIDKLNKFLSVDINAKNAVSFAGMGAGAEFAKSDDPSTSVAENAAREIAGGLLGGTLPHASIGAVKGVANVLASPFQTLLAETTGGKINKEAVNAAKKLGLHLPPSLATDSNLAKGIENTVLKSWFSSKAYNEVIEKIPQAMVKEIDKNLDEIGAKVIGTDYKAASSVASDEYKAALQSQALEWQEQSKVLFDNALKSLTEADIMQTPKTLEVVKSMKQEMSRGVREPEGAKKALLDDLNQLEAKLGSGNVQVRDLIAEQQDLSRLGKYGDTEGLGNLYNGIAGTLTDELASYKANKAFVDSYMPARAFYKENIINKLRTDTAKNILSEQAPKEAISFMSTPQRIRELEHILGNSENAKEIMGSLKRAKISQILSDTGIINSTGEFNSGAFIRVFGRENKEPLLKALMGENYSKVQANIMPIATAITTSGKVLANPSGTANTLKDTGLVVGAATGLATGSLGTSGTALGGVALINLISRAFANPKYLEKLIARSNRNERVKEVIKNPAKARDVSISKAQDIFSRPSTKALGLKMFSNKKEDEKE